MEPTKPFYASKTFYVNVLAMVALVVGSKMPAVSDFIKNYFAELGSGWALVNIVLRAISKDKLSLW
jgi:hypothetical protein